MSAAFAIWAQTTEIAECKEWKKEESQPCIPPPELPPPACGDSNLAFYRKHTEKTLRRYLYASILVGRAPTILREPLSRGWASSRPVKTFEDAVIFVLDIERCLDHLNYLDRQILGKVVLQDYTQAETAVLLGMSSRSMSVRYPEAIDRLTRILLDADLLILPG
jgi:hypothetical protein